MTVTLQLANQVRRLGRENLTVEQIAGRLALPEVAILETLSLPLPGETLAQRTGPTDGEHAERLAKLPKRWQDRRASAVLEASRAGALCRKCDQRAASRSSSSPLQHDAARDER